jgi:hypothetical protein
VRPILDRRDLRDSGAAGGGRPNCGILRCFWGKREIRSSNYVGPLAVEKARRIMLRGSPAGLGALESHDSAGAPGAGLARPTSGERLAGPARRRARTRTPAKCRHCGRRAGATRAWGAEDRLVRAREFGGHGVSGRPPARRASTARSAQSRRGAERENRARGSIRNTAHGRRWFRASATFEAAAARDPKARVLHTSRCSGQPDHSSHIQGQSAPTNEKRHGQ